MIRIFIVIQILAALAFGCRVVAVRGQVWRSGHDLAQLIEREVDLRAIHQELDLMLSEESMPSRLRERALELRISIGDLPVGDSPQEDIVLNR